MEQKVVQTVVVIGHYGSGKTTLAVNLALDYRRRGEDVILCDLDLVNPYFRSSDFAELAAREGVELITPLFAGTNLDLPAVTPRLDAVLSQSERTLVIDAGGDDAGSTALGRYAARLTAAHCHVLYVINASRPITQTPEEAVELLREIEAASHLKATHIVNNTHLSQFTDPELIESSTGYARAVCNLTGLPLLFTAVKRELSDRVQLEGELYPVDILVKPPWG